MQEMFVDRPAEGNVPVEENFPGFHFGPLPLDDGEVRLRILVDRNGVEVFGNEGRTVISDLLFPLSSITQVELYAEGDAPDALEVALLCERRQ